MTVIGTGNYVPEHGIAMSQAFPELANQNSYLGEYVALYAIRELLRKSNTDGFVGFCHYRRITLTKQHGELRRINIHAHPNQLQAMSLVDFYWDRNTPIIPATASMMVSILQQYAVCGLNSRDLLLYFASAIDCNVITSAEAAEFLSSNQLISAPTVSFIPICDFIDLVNALELVNTHFYKNHYIEQYGYQARAMAFCCERLHSYLLAKKAMQWGQGTYIALPSTVLSLDDGAAFQANAEIKSISP